MRQEMRYTAGQAAKATGKSIPTITRAIKKGTISAERTSSGGYLIDPAELHRVFPAVTPHPNEKSNTLDFESSQDRVVSPGLDLEIRMLREMLAREQETVADLRARLDAEAEERRHLTLLLTHQSKKSDSTSTPTQRRKFWWTARKQ